MSTTTAIRFLTRTALGLLLFSAAACSNGSFSRNPACNSIDGSAEAGAEAGTEAGVTTGGCSTGCSNAGSNDAGSTSGSTLDSGPSDGGALDGSLDSGLTDCGVDGSLDGSGALPDGASADGGSSGDAGDGSVAIDSGVDSGVDSGPGPCGCEVDLGSAGGFVILSKSGISTVPPSAITGNIGVSPGPATMLTGWSLIADATNVFSTSAQITGRAYAANYAPPTPSNMTTAISNMETAFTDAAGRAPGVTELGAGNIGGMTLNAGVYKWGTGLLIPTNLTLSGNANAVWIFQIAKDLTVSNAVQITLSGGALPKNIFWQVSGKVTIGTTAHLEGIVLCQTAITLRTGATVNGRLLAQTAVNLDSNTVVAPAP